MTAPLGAMTYVPAEDEAHDLQTALDTLLPHDGRDRPTLFFPELGVLELPEPVTELVMQVVRAVAAGEGISVIPRHKQLTTQECADMLGISRPTLVRLLEAGEIAFEKRGRHRRVRLDDLVAYQERSRKDRSEALDHMVSLGEDGGMYDMTAGAPTRMR